MKTFFLLLLTVGMLTAGCGDSKKEETSAEKKNEVKAGSEGSTENKASQETEQSKDELAAKEEANTDPAGSDNKQNDLGMTPGLPADFPKDVPTPKNSKTLGSLNSTEGTVVTFEATDMVPAIISYYKDEMKKNGYEIVEGSENLVSDKGGVLSWKKNGKEVGLMLGYDKDKNITSLVITYK